MAAKAGGGSTAITAHSVVGEWTHVSNRDLNKVTAIKEVAESLDPLKEKWMDVGKLFKLTKEVLEEIHKKYEGSHEKCLREIVGKWLSSDCNPTWQLLAKTVASLDANVSEAIARSHPAGEDEKPDVNDLMNAIATKINHMWRQVGLQLGLKDGELASFQMMNPRALECWREVITSWKRRADDNHKYCLATMFSALTSHEVAADDVAKDYYKTLQEVHKLNSKYEKGRKEISNEDLKDLMNKVGYRVKDSWRSLGSELGLPVSELNSIGISNQERSIDCIRNVFSKWTRSQTKKPVNWQTLLVSLCKPQVDQKVVADEVYRDFLKGNC